MPLPGPYNDSFDSLERMILIKAIRPDKLRQSVQKWVTEKLGLRFIEPPPFNLEKCYSDSTMCTPLIFVLSTGSDPKADFDKFAKDMQMDKKNESISLGNFKSLKIQAKDRARRPKEWSGTPSKGAPGCSCRTATWPSPGCLNWRNSAKS